MKNKRLFRILTFIVVLLLLPMIAMQFTSQVNWTLSDFIFVGTLLLATGFGVKFTLRTVRTVTSRLIASGVILFLFLLVWAELAVGIFGTPFAES